MTLDEFNWAKCYDEEPKVAEMLNAHRNRWRAFWDMENASQVAESNYSRNSSEIESSIEDLQKAWNVAQAATAGKAFANYHRLLTAFPDEL